MLANGGPWSLYGGRLARLFVRFIPLVGGLLLSGVITLTNLGLSKEFVGYDAGVSLLRPESNASQLHIWNPVFAPGSYSPLNLLATPWVTASEFLSRVGMPPILIQRLYYGLLILTAFVGGYKLIELVATRLMGFSPNAGVYIAAAVGASWYAFNPYSMLLMTFPSTPHELGWSLLPLGLALIVNGMTRSGSLVSAAITGAVWAVIASGNVALTLVDIVTGSVVAGICLASVDRKIQVQALRYLAAVAALTLVLTSFFWLPLLGGGNPVADANRINDQSTSVVFAALFSSVRASFLNLVRLDGSTAMPEQAYFALTNSLLPFIAGIVLPLAAGLALVVPIRARRTILWLAVMAGVFLFLAKGEHEPFGGPMTWLYSHVSFAGAFRNSYDKFLPPVMIAESIMIACFTLWLGQHRGLIVRLATTAILGAAAVYPGIFLAGKVADSRYLVAVPLEYQQLEAYLSTRGPRPTIFSGPDFGGRAYYTWYQGNSSPDPVLLGVPTVTEQWLRSEGIVPIMADGSSYEEAMGAAFDMLPRLGVGYVLIHKDFLPYLRTGPYLAPSEIPTGGQGHALLMQTQAESRNDMHLVLDNRYFSLYQYCGSLVRPAVYSTSRIVVFDQSPTSAAGQTCEPVNPAEYPASVSANPKASPTSSSTESISSPLELLQASDERYRVRLQASKSSLLVLSQTYDSSWEAHVETTGTSLSHVLANGYLNGWLLPRAGRYDIEIRYRPADVVGLAGIVSLFGLTAVGAMLVIGTGWLTVPFNRSRPVGGSSTTQDSAGPQRDNPGERSEASAPAGKLN